MTAKSFPRAPILASVGFPSQRSGQVSLDEAKDFLAQSGCQRRYAPTVFEIILECRTESSRIQRSASPESPPTCARLRCEPHSIHESVRPVYLSSQSELGWKSYQSTKTVICCKPNA